MNATTENLIRHWNVSYLGPIRRQAKSFWESWTGELVACLPESMRQSLASASQRSFVQISGSELRVFRGSIDRMQEVACYGMEDDARPTPLKDDSRDTVLLLPPHLLLRTSASLPAATEENLREVLAFEMDQLTPFSIEQVYYDFEVTARSPATRTIDVQLYAAPRRAIDDLLATLQRLGLRPDVVSGRDGRGGMHAINLLPAGLARRRINLTRRLNIGLACTAVLLMVAVACVPLLQKRQLIAELEPQVAAAMEAAKEGTRLRRNIEIIATGAEELLQKKEAQPLLLELIDEMTRVIPDDTWLTRLDIAGNEIQVQGSSKSAAALIGLVEASPLYDATQFRSPVTQVPRTDDERFHLSTTWRAKGED